MTEILAWDLLFRDGSIVYSLDALVLPLACYRQDVPFYACYAYVSDSTTSWTRSPPASGMFLEATVPGSPQ